MVKILVKQNNTNNSGDGNDNPFVDAVNAVVYMDDVPLEVPKTKIVKKWPGNCFGAFPDDMPKKLSKKGPRRIWDHKKTNFAWVFDK